MLDECLKLTSGEHADTVSAVLEVVVMMVMVGLLWLSGLAVGQHSRRPWPEALELPAYVLAVGEEDENGELQQSCHRLPDFDFAGGDDLEDDQ